MGTLWLKENIVQVGDIELKEKIETGVYFMVKREDCTVCRWVF